MENGNEYDAQITFDPELIVKVEKDKTENMKEWANHSIVECLLYANMKSCIREEY